MFRETEIKTCKIAADGSIADSTTIDCRNASSLWVDLLAAKGEHTIFHSNDGVTWKSISNVAAAVFTPAGNGWYVLPVDFFGAAYLRITADIAYSTASVLDNVNYVLKR